ncbi:ubiquinone anaerobic biosynthesis accessory factor UbiT [Massilia alkalitolerans]
MRTIMHHAPQLLPPPVGRLLSLLPAYPGSCLFAAALNRILVRHLPEDVRAGLAGKRLRLRALDAGIAFDFVWRGRAFAPARRSGEADLSISASLRDFALLAARKEDPDTLFFSRRLVMEGDTELGLLVKNTLDAIEHPLFSLDGLLPRRPGSLRASRQGASHA